MTKTTVPARPFEKIALSCSGGGYRAASFHLGSMSYLNHLCYDSLPLLERIKMISTVSGGTITGVVYALGKQKKQSFAQIYTFLLGQLRQLDLVKEGIEKLNPEGIWQNPHKHKNLINAFAELYDEHLTGGALLGCLDKSSHLEAVVFNSTEFNNAINFRFKNRSAGLTGNNPIKIGHTFAAEIRLSDIMAASSCFPGGFEPIIWPYDFLHDKAPNIRKMVNAKLPPVGLMDGGIYDNQGIESILNYKKKKDELPYFDLVIISDVASPYMDAYAPFKEAPKEGFYKWTLGELKTRTRKIIKNIDVALLTAIIVLAALPALWHYANNIATGGLLGLSLMFAVLLIVKHCAVQKAESVLDSLLDKIKGVIPKFYQGKLAGFRLDEISLHRAEPLILDRINSLKTLLMSVFLKVVRRLNYRFLYQDDQYAYRRITNLIKELTAEDFKEKVLREKEDSAPDSSLQQNSILYGAYLDIVGPEIKKVADKASAFGTTLWFTDEEQLGDMLRQLVCTGQFTMCYNLLEYLEELIFKTDSGFAGLDQAVKTALLATYQACKTDWELFKITPGFLYDQTGKIKRDSNSLPF